MERRSERSAVETNYTDRCTKKILHVFHDKMVNKYKGEITVMR